MRGLVECEIGKPYQIQTNVETTVTICLLPVNSDFSSSAPSACEAPNGCPAVSLLSQS